jgi:hypothetical protein
MSQAVFCVADSEARAERIVRDLRDAGFGEQYISVLFPDADGTRELSDDEAHSKAPEGASTGVGTGALVGGTIGWLSGVGAIAVPGLGALVAAGPILATLSAATAGATVGGLAGALVGYAVPELEAKLYEGKLGRELPDLRTRDQRRAAGARAGGRREERRDRHLATVGSAGLAGRGRRPDYPAPTSRARRRCKLFGSA